MRRILHIVTQPDDLLAGLVIDQQRSANEYDVVVIDLTGGEPNYKKLVDEIFAADSIESW